jgi:protein O-mannosyl-transferase
LLLFFSLLRRFTSLFVAFLFFIITLIPVSGIAPAGTQIAADRFTYIPSMGLALIFGGFLVYLGLYDGDKLFYFKKTIFALAIIIIAVSCGLTWNQEKLWKDSKTIWEHTVLLSPDSSIAHFKVGEEWLEEGRVAEAVDQYKLAFSLNPSYKETYLNLAGTFIQRGMFAEGEWFYKALIQTYPSFEPAWVSLGGTYFNEGYGEKAIAVYGQALQINPQFSMVKEDLTKVINWNQKTKH